MREFLKKSVAVVMAVTACLTVSVVSYIEKPVSALTVIANIKDVTVKKSVISVGESTQLSVDWDYGGTLDAYIYSSNQSIVKVENSSENGCTLTGVGAGTAEITVNNTPYSKTVEVEVVSSNNAIPKNFDEALDFYNKYGSTHIDGITVCYVRPVYKTDIYTCCLDIAESSDLTEYTSCNRYEFVPPDDGDYDFVQFNMEVVTFELPESSDLEFVTYTKDSAGTKRDMNTYSFTSDENGNVTETDMFAWLPDCMGEYESFINTNGTVSLHDNYIIYCGDVNYSTGAEIIFEQFGTAEVKEIYKGSVNLLDIYPPAPGNTSHKVILYQPVSEGTVKLNWTVARPWDMSHIDNENTNYFAVDENLTVTEIEEKDFIEPVKGDVNGDGEFNVADAVLLQQWLSKKTDGIKGNADVNGDGKVNAFDMVLLKRMLMSQNKPDEKITWEIAPIANSDKFRDTLDKEYIITSTKELVAYFFSIYGGIIECDVVCPENETVTEFFNKYDYEFFENNVLLMKPFYQFHSNGNFPYAIEDVMYSGDTLCVYYTDNTYGDCIEVFNPYLALVTVPKALYHAENVMWINVTIGFDGITEIKDSYIAVFHGIADDLMNETYIYKIDNGADNYGFEYINVSRSSFSVDHTERVTITGQGSVMWTDNVFQVAEANDAYDYVTVPNDEKRYTIDEFMEKFLMD